MFDGVLGLVAIVALIAAVIWLNARLSRMEREHKALLTFVLANPQVGAPPVAAAQAVAAEPAPASTPEATAPPAEISLLSPTDDLAPPVAETVPPPPSAEPPQPAIAATRPPETSRKPADVETALGTRWAVWVGGIALALGGVFLVRYSIEQGFFGPQARLVMAALFGLALLGAGEFIRRTGFKMPVEGAVGAFIPAILTAAGAFTLFAVIYAAHGIYGFIGPATAFVLLGVVGVATMAAALIHGQALGGLGLLGSLATPVLVASDAPNSLALFGFLAVVLATTVAVARLRHWVLLATAAFAGTGLWVLVYLASAFEVDLTVVLFIAAVLLATLAFAWLGRAKLRQAAVDWPSIATAVVLGITTLALLNDPVFRAQNGVAYGTVLVLAMLALAVWRAAALPLLFGAGVVVCLAYAVPALSTTLSLEVPGGSLSVDGLPPQLPDAALKPVGWLFAALFLAAGLWRARTRLATPRSALIWAVWAALVPVVVVTALWLTFGNIDRDYFYAAAALGLAVLLAAGAEWIARGEEPPLTGGLAVSAALVGAAVAGVVFFHMAFGSGLTTMLIGAAAVLPALATRQRAYPALGWLSVGLAVVVLGRAAIDPTIVGAADLGRTPVFNALLPGYGIPALAFVFAAWQLARTTGGRPRLAMEAVAALFSLLTVAMLVRHAMNGGVIDDAVPTLAEQAIYTLMALGAGAILVAIDMRSPSSVMRYGSLAAGVLSVALAVLQHFLFLNPLFTDESTGRIPFFNLLFLAYLLPAAAAGALAYYARGKRPKWYSAMLGLLAAVLAFAYATLSVRRWYQGEFIGLWRDMTQLETYTYSALWLALGVVILVVGVWQKSYVLRVASGGLIAIAVAKVFLFDMSELEGVLRALSFIGLGAVLIGIGLFYQKLLTGEKRREEASAAEATPPA